MTTLGTSNPVTDRPKPIIPITRNRRAYRANRKVKPLIKSSLSPPSCLVMGPTHRRPPRYENKGMLVRPCWARHGCQGQFKGRSHQGYRLNSQWLRAVILKLQLSLDELPLLFLDNYNRWRKSKNEKTLDLYLYLDQKDSRR